MFLIADCEFLYNFKLVSAMENLPGIKPIKKRKINIDCHLCILCQDKTKEILCSSPSLDSFEKLLTRCRKRAKYKDISVIGFVGRTQNIEAADLANTDAKYHRSCYSKYANTQKVIHAEKRFKDSLESGQVSTVINCTPGRPSASK